MWVPKAIQSMSLHSHWMPILENNLPPASDFRMSWMREHACSLSGAVRLLRVFYGSTWTRFDCDSDVLSESTSCCKLSLNWQQGSQLKSQGSPISLRPKLRHLIDVCLSRQKAMIELRGVGGLCMQRTPSEEWFRILDWFKKITKSGLGLQGTQWHAYIHVRLCYQ